MSSTTESDRVQITRNERDVDAMATNTTCLQQAVEKPGYSEL